MRRCVAGDRAARSDRCGFLGLRLGRLRETLTERAQLRHLSRLEFGIPSREILERVVEPLLLVVGVTPDDTALHDLLEQLVTGFLIRRVHHDVTTRTKLGLSHFLWESVWNGSWPVDPASMNNLTA